MPAGAHMSRRVAQQRSMRRGKACKEHKQQLKDEPSPNEFLDACFRGEEEEVWALLGRGVDANGVNEHGQTALHLLVRGLPCCDECAGQFWRRELARELVEGWCLDPMRKDFNGMTPRDHALAMNFNSFARELWGLAVKRKRRVPLRFGIKCRVEAHHNKGYLAGYVVRHWERGHAYRIKLDSGLQVWAPLDVDTYVRAPQEHKNPDAGSDGSSDGGGRLDDASSGSGGGGSEVAPGGPLGQEGGPPGDQRSPQRDGSRSTSLDGLTDELSPDGDGTAGTEDEEMNELIRRMFGGGAAENNPTAFTERIQLDPEIYNSVRQMAEEQACDKCSARGCACGLTASQQSQRRRKKKRGKRR